MKEYLVTAATLLTVGLIAGCGSGGMSTTSGTSTSTTSITGKVADGYLANATVFMDKNGNYQLDPGEPSATTDANGAYTLMNVDPADVGKYPVVALATKDVTTDSDTGVVVANSYVLSMPKDSISGTVNSNFISPISSQLREMMETGKYASVAAAMAALSPRLGMSVGANLLVNYMDTSAANHAAMHTAAQKIAGVMGGQMAQVMGTSGASTTVQVDRYRGMMGAIFSNISSIKSTNPQVNNTQIVSTINTMLTNMPMTSAGQPYRNMSSSFRGGMMGGNNSTGSMGNSMGH